MTGDTPPRRPNADPEPHSACGPGCTGSDCGPCVAQLSSPRERLAALRAALEVETEPLVTLTHLLHLCRDEHRTLWERGGAGTVDLNDGAALAAVAAQLPAAGARSTLDESVRHALAAALEPGTGVEPVVIARGLAQLVDERFGHAFNDSFRARSPYQPGVGDPIPLGGPDLRGLLEMRPTSPPWRLANRLDQTRRIRLAGEWATQFRIVFDYGLFDILAGLIGADTVLATCHPNRLLSDFDLPADRSQPSFGVQPSKSAEQARELDELIGLACGAGADIVLLPELCVTEPLARDLQRWVRGPGRPRLLVAGSFHHDDRHAGEEANPAAVRRRNTALAWVRGHDAPLTQDKHSPADRPVVEDIHPEGWPTLHVYVTADGWHVVISICRDLLNPQAVHALTEAGANLILVPTMSETLVPFGGPVAQLVGSNQAIVALANNPADWSTDEAAVRPARALFGHPGLGQQTRFVQSTEPRPGVGLLAVRSAHISWLDQPAGEAAQLDVEPLPRTRGPVPGWLSTLQRSAAPPTSSPQLLERVAVRPAAVLVLFCMTDAGPAVLLTERAPDLSHYPGQLVFPGGATDPTDRGPVATALREAAEEIGLDRDTVHVLGTLPALGLPDSGFLVTPVLAWNEHAPVVGGGNQAEVSATYTVPVSQLSAWLDRDGSNGPLGSIPAPDLSTLGRMTRDVLRLLIPAITPAPDESRAS